jgi:tRNA(adenine34) deaminase
MKIRFYLFALLIIPAALLPLLPFSIAADDQLPDLDAIEKRINAYVPDKQYPDDPYILVAVREALAGGREKNGGVGACLVEEATGKIIEVGHNRQFEPYFRSDLHAEMDILTRYEERIKARRLMNSTVSTEAQRKVEGLVLYTSVEPCPMCLSRIINMRLKKTCWAAPDPSGGMAHKIQDLPTFWRELASGRIFEPARCSPELVEIAKSLFRPMVKQ